jgi:glycosyltransferase involved in cell wall biosynthesis
MVYLGAVNTGRGVELAIRSLQTLIEHRLVIIGDGDEYDQMRDLAVALNVIHRVDFRGYTTPDKIFSILQECSIGLNVLVAESDNYRLSLANKFFDYMHAGLPSVNMRYPEYENIINDHHVGIMIRDYNVDDLVTAVRMLDNIDLYNQLADNCSKFKHLYTWNREKEVLVGLYDLLW